MEPASIRSEKMQKYIVPIAAAVALGMAAPAMAYDTGGVMSMQAAVDEAADMGLVSVSHTNFLGDEWGDRRPG
jgi:hypothetical protein